MERFSPTAEEMAKQFEQEAHLVSSIYMDLDGTAPDTLTDDYDNDVRAQRRQRHRSARRRSSLAA
jgi:hypothetical protein